MTCRAQSPAPLVDSERELRSLAGGTKTWVCERQKTHLKRKKSLWYERKITLCEVGGGNALCSIKYKVIKTAVWTDKEQQCSDNAPLNQGIIGGKLVLLCSAVHYLMKAGQTQWPTQLTMNKYAFYWRSRSSLISKKPCEAVLYHCKRLSLKTARILCSYKIVATAKMKYTNVQEIFIFIIIQCQNQFYIVYVAPFITTRVDQWDA